MIARLLHVVGLVRLKPGQVVVEERAVMLLVSRIHIHRRRRDHDSLEALTEESRRLVDSIERGNP